MNYVTVIYLLNLGLYLLWLLTGISDSSHRVMDYFVSGILALFLLFSGYLNAKKKMTYRSVLWIFFVNVLLFICSGLFDQFGNGANALSFGDSIAFTWAFCAYNAYVFPLIIALEDSGFSLVIPLIMSFMLPSLGFFMGEEKGESNNVKEKI